MRKRRAAPRRTGLSTRGLHAVRRAAWLDCHLLTLGDLHERVTGEARSGGWWWDRWLRRTPAAEAPS